MNKKNVECIFRMLELGAFDEFKEFLIDIKVASEESFIGLNRTSEKARFICEALHKAAEDELLLLLDYEWTLLPFETIKITCVTEREKKEFSHGW